MTNQDYLREWYKLDTSAKIYPALESPRNTTLFRISMSLKQNVDVDVLHQALDDIKPRFPYFNVHLRTGLFWNYLEKNDNPSIIWPETPIPCERIYSVYNNGYLYMIRVHENRIAVEFSHVLTDGFGGMEFLKTLVAHYLYLHGDLKQSLKLLFNPGEIPEPQEYEDAFLKVLEIEKDSPKKNDERALFNDSKVYKIKDRVLPVGRYEITSAVVSVSDLKQIAHQFGVKITELLAGLYLEALLYCQNSQIKKKSKHRRISMQIPVNMRQFYPIKSMRNFSLFLVPAIDPREIRNFEDILAAIRNHMEKNANRDFLQTMVRDNCALGESKFIAHVPLGIKKMVIRYLANTKGMTQFSGTISNLGVCRLPKEMEKHVRSMNCILGPPNDTKTVCTVLGYKDKITITFGRTIKHAEIEKHIFRRLVDMGASVEIHSN